MHILYIIKIEIGICISKYMSFEKMLQACVNDQVDVLEKLLADNINGDLAPVAVYAVTYNKLYILKLLSKYKYPVGDYLLAHAVKIGDHAVIEHLIKYSSLKAINIALLEACRIGCCNIVGMLIKLADINYDNGKPLLYAVQNEHHEVVKNLVLAGAKKDTRLIQIARSRNNLCVEIWLL